MREFVQKHAMLDPFKQVDAEDSMVGERPRVPDPLQTFLQKQ